MSTRRSILTHCTRLATAALALTAGLAAGPAAAQTTVRVAYMKIPPLVPLLHAERSGLFKKEGLDVQIQVVNGEPPMMTGVVSGSVDIGMTGVGGVLLAYAAGQPLNIFGTTDVEHAGDIRTWIVANKAKGITSMKDLAGKTVAIVAPNTQADMMVRDHLAAVGLKPDAVKMVAMPFPQMQAAMETGNVDAAMMGDPFHSSVLASKKIEAIDIAKGSVADYSKAGGMALGGWFTRADWLKQNPQVAARFLRALSESHKQLMADRKLINAIFEKDFGMPPPVAANVPLNLRLESLEAQPKDYTAMIEAMHRTGLSKKVFPAAEMVQNIKY